MDANPTGAELATQEPLSESDDLTSQLAALVDNEGAPEESSFEEGAEEGQPEEAKPEPDSEPIYTVKVDGQEIQVKQSELLAGYQRDADYRNKTKAVAEQRQAIEAERQSVIQERNQALQVIQQYQAELGQMLQPNVDWNQLLESDPTEYLRQKHLYEQRAFQYQQAEQQKQWLMQQEQAERQQHLQKYIQTESEQLVNALPDWKDPAKAQAEKAAIKSYLKGAGFADQDIGSVADHRQIVIARKAMMYDQLMQKAAQTTKKVEKLPSRVERPGSSEISATDGRTQAMKRLKASGKVDDAAAIFESFL